MTTIPILIGVAGWLAVVACAYVARSRTYAAYSAISLGLQLLIWGALLPHAGALQLPFAALQGLVFVHYLRLVWPRLRSTVYDALSDGLSPLAQLMGCVVACHGNHDLEAPGTVSEACRRNGR